MIRNSSVRPDVRSRLAVGVALTFTAVATQAASPSNVIVHTSAEEGFRIQSTDGANVLRLRGLLHFDGRHYSDDATPETADTWLLRRVRPVIEGTLNGIFDYRFTPDFGGGRTVILDAFVAVRLKRWATITAGKFKVPVGLERLVSATDLRFIERGFPTGLVPNRDLGVQLNGEFSDGLFAYSIGYFNGVSDGGSSDGHVPADAENDTRGDWATRVFVQPFLESKNAALHGLGFGIGGTYVDSTGSTSNALLPAYRTPGQQVFFKYRPTTGASAAASGTFADGERLRLAPQAYYSIGRFSALGEYVEVTQGVSRATPTAGVRSDELDHRAWQIQLAWFATGEMQSFRGLQLRSGSPPANGSWGAFELVTRYHELDIDDAAFNGDENSFADPAVAATKASAWGVGVNWYLNQNCKWSLGYDVTSFEGGDATGDRRNERVLFTRFALAF